MRNPCPSLALGRIVTTDKLLLVAKHLKGVAAQPPVTQRATHVAWATEAAIARGVPQSRR